MMYLLKTKCSKCEGKLATRNAVYIGLDDIPEQPDVPWVKVNWDRKRFDICENGHKFNIRPYADYDEHYIYEDKLKARIKNAKRELSDLQYGV